ncbi:MAG TPA: hypothetical protein VGI04_03315 [Neobacillus sp.]|jgi:hypothetical protein
MNKPMSEKERLISMLTEIYDQLEGLESVLEITFSDLRTNLNKNELTKINGPEQRISKLEKLFSFKNDTPTDFTHLPTSRSLKLEMGF